MQSGPLSFGPPAPMHPGYPAGKWFSTFSGAPASTAAVPAIDTIYFYPFWLPKSLTFTAILARVVTGGAGSSAKVGIWANQSSNNHPAGAPLFADNTGASTAAASTPSFAAAGTLPAGFYWAGTKFTGTLPILFAIPSANQFMYSMMGGDNNTIANNAISMADVYANTMPTIGTAQTFTGVSSSGVPFIFFAT